MHFRILMILKLILWFELLVTNCTIILAFILLLVVVLMVICLL